nr:reverse transcriptase domain-containing protein [Tanacetum cinerariifolium]
MIHPPSSPPSPSTPMSTHTDATSTQPMASSTDTQTADPPTTVSAHSMVMSSKDDEYNASIVKAKTITFLYNPTSQTPIPCWQSSPLPFFKNLKTQIKGCDHPLGDQANWSNLRVLLIQNIQTSIPMLQSVKTYLGKCFAMKDLGEAAYILGIKIYRDRSRRLIGLCQSAYIEKILKRYCMENSKRGSIPMQKKLKLSKSQGASTPAELKRMQNVPYTSAVGSIMYAVRCTRLDVEFAQNVTSRFQQNLELRVSYYTDAGYLTDADDLKSQTGYVFVLNGGAVDWKSAKQSIFATSSAEDEYIVAFDASKEAVWVRKFISRLGVVPTIEEPISMYCDNTEAITIANEFGITKGARHFRAKVHYLREVIEYGDIKLEKVHTDDSLADPFTKELAFPKHSKHTRNIRMLPASSLMVTVPSYVFILLGIRVFRELSKLRIRGVNGFTSSHVHGFVKSSSVEESPYDSLVLWQSSTPRLRSSLGVPKREFSLVPSLGPSSKSNLAWTSFRAVLASPGLLVGFMTVVTRGVGGLADPEGISYGSSSGSLYQVNLFETLHKGRRHLSKCYSLIGYPRNAVAGTLRLYFAPHNAISDAFIGEVSCDKLGPNIMTMNLQRMMTCLAESAISDVLNGEASCDKITPNTYDGDNNFEAKGNNSPTENTTKIKSLTTVDRYADIGDPDRDSERSRTRSYCVWKKYVKDPVEIHNIKQKDGETIEDFMERFKTKTGRIKGAPECMRISGFMHGVNNPELTKHLNEHVPKTMKEMMITTTAFIRREAAAARKKEGHASWKPQDQPKRHSSDKRPDFRGHPRGERGSNRFTPLTRTPKESWLPKQHRRMHAAEEADRGVSTSHLIKEIKQGRDQSKTGKKETAAKDKPTAIYMVQSWQRTVKQKVTQSFERVREIAFPQLTASNGTEGPLVIEAEMGGHVIHRMYIDGGSSMEILYEHCFNRLRPEIKSQMVPATTSMTGFSVPSTIYGMLKFPVEGGIAIIRSTILISTECTSVTTSYVIPREERASPANFTVALHPDFPDQEIVIGG